MRPCVDSAAAIGARRRSTLGRLSHFFFFFTFLSSLVYDRSSSSSLVALKIVDSPLPPFLQDERKGGAWFVVFSALPLHFTLSEGGGGRGGRKRRGGGKEELPVELAMKIRRGRGGGGGEKGGS